MAVPSRWEQVLEFRAAEALRAVHDQAADAREWLNRRSAALLRWQRVRAMGDRAFLLKRWVA